MDEQDEELRKLVNSSGFPFQMAIQNEIESLKTRPEWEIITTEHHWKNGTTGTDGWIDIVTGYGIVRLIIECKRPRGGNWIFLSSNDNQEKVSRFRTLCGCWKNSNSLKQGWFDLEFLPESQESEFCVIRGQEESSQSLLERLGGQLISSVEALAIEALNLIRNTHKPLLIFLPAIVTSAELKICRFKSREIAIQDGTIKAPDFETVPYVRFRKTLATSDIEYSNFDDLSEIKEVKERSLFIINSLKLRDFLSEWEVPVYTDRQLQKLLSQNS